MIETRIFYEVSLLKSWNSWKTVGLPLNMIVPEISYAETCIHPASRGVAAHTAGLFRPVRGAKGGFSPRGGSPS